MTQNRRTFTDLNALFRTADADVTVDRIDSAVRALGAREVRVRAKAISLVCEPDNMLVAEYEQIHDGPPVTEELHRITVEAGVPTDASTDGDISDSITRAVVGALPTGPDGTAAVWFGSTRYDEPNDDSDIPNDSHGDDRP
jgi:hypothetical protein